MTTTVPRVLLLEDDPGIAKTVVYALERAGCGVTHCLLVTDALRQISTGTYDVVVLDIGLPDGSGLDVCKALRADPAAQTMPVLMLSAHSEEIDRVLGLELGADDYVTKPFSPRELVARVRALLRRSAMQIVKTPESKITLAPGLEIDLAGQRVLAQGLPLPLTRREFGLLAALVGKPGRIWSRESLLDTVWGNDSASTDRTVDTHIKTLRAKLMLAAPGRELIETHRGMGYSVALPKV